MTWPLIYWLFLRLVSHGLHWKVCYLVTSLKNVIYVVEGRNPFTDYHGVIGFVTHGIMQPPFWLALAGVATAYWLYMVKTDWPAAIQARFQWLHTLLDNKYYADTFNEKFFSGGARGLGGFFVASG